jgi:adenylate kinase family enzyme
MQRVSVIGVTGAGKTTLAAALAAKLQAPHVELDALHWEPNWTMAELHVFRRRVASHIAADRWVIDGNYSKVRDLVWGRADTVVWLDYPFAVTFARLLRRTFARVWSGQELWNGNRERFAEQFLSRDSLLAWAIKTHPKYRATFPMLFADESYGHLRVVRLRRPREAQRWLSSL